MSYATLLVYVDAAEDADTAVRVAAELADRFNATLIGLCALEGRPQFVTEGVVLPDAVQADIKEMRVKLADKGVWFRSIAATGRRKAEWRAMLEFPAEALAREARCADLVVMRRTGGSSHPSGALEPGGAILRVGRPVLVVPDGIAAPRAEHVVIGWKDRREARRALRDALPFLRDAGRVTIVEICDRGEEDAARGNMDEVAGYLARHRIVGGPRVILHQNGSGAAALLRVAKEEGADLLVTGAYGHSRLGEWMFGGVTRDLLATSPIACLMSH
jgi:nucleotide-binding universal stress UspA family protein